MSRIGDFNPRSPGGERLNNGVTPSNKVEFQSTLPGWGATHLHVGHAVRVDISIHAPRVGSDAGHPVPARLDGRISIHAPRMGSDGHGWNMLPGSSISIHAPRMGSDRDTLQYRLLAAISIHAPRMGSDLHGIVQRHFTVHNFNPRSPDGERPEPPTV